MIKRDCRDRGISYAKANRNKVWKYFKKVWIHTFIPKWWIINRVSVDVVNRTSNTLERYNPTLNSPFSGAHPDITQFIDVIEKQSRENVRLQGDISNRRAHAPIRADSQRAPGFESDSSLKLTLTDLEVNDSAFDASDSANYSTRSISPEY
ncbi:hypothetical protein ON010_g12209 [Phytophthora cinnamomi]|nr:hypothetical protein ON010_g12209 [Phytophthora cinnamomi]